MVSHLDMQKIQIIEFFFSIGYIGSLKFSCYYLQYVLTLDPFDCA